FLNNGAGGFRPPIVLQTGGLTHGVTVIDANSDGLPDIATTNHSSVLLFINLGNGNFAAPVSFEAGNGEDGIKAADANGDGKADLFVACYTGGTVGLLLGDGNGNFTLTASRSCGGNPFQIAVGDLNGDGACDAVTANRGTDSLGVVFGNGTGGLTSTVTWPASSSPAAVDVGDLDGDGDLDVVLSAYGSGTFHVYWNNGAAGFASTFTLPSTQNASCATLVDFDRDGYLDLLATDEGADEVRIYVQNRPALPNVQPLGCLATLRVDNWAVAGYGGRPLRPVRAGNTVFFGVTAAATVPFALMGGPSLVPGQPFPFGLANLDPLYAGVMVIGFFGNPVANTNAAGEATVAVPVPAGLVGALYTQVVALDTRPASAGLLFSNPVGIAFVP
ncbi:MAG TPA: VCBS repeat-containing protein, partial [Planctomycetota bacterium]|nr:VCBS repeat-containing protein [Planctomycetota bacterium]